MNKNGRRETRESATLKELFIEIGKLTTEVETKKREEPRAKIGSIEEQSDQQDKRLIELLHLLTSEEKRKIIEWLLSVPYA